MSYYLSVLKDSPSGFWKLDESFGSIAYDSSGCGNNGAYIGTISNTPMPIVSGGSHSTKITDTNYLQFEISKNFWGIDVSGGFGTTKTSDNDFSLEVWFHPKNLTNLTPILADTSGIGIYWDNGNILFKLENEEIYYSVPNPQRVLHVVAVYSVNSISLYLNGELVKSKSVSRINFTNESLSFNCGPAETNKYFIIDAPAIYRYSLNLNSIINHYNNFISNTESNIVLPDSGEIFKASEKHQNINTTVSFPAQLDWQYHIDDNILYRESTNSLYLSPSSTQGQFIKVISFPLWKNYVSSKIEWLSSNGVSIDVSVDGENGAWQACENGKALPGFSQGSNFSNNKVLYFRVTFESSDSNKYVPELYYMKIHFYDEKILFAHGGGSKISVSQPNSGSSWEISISNSNTNILLRESDNGIITSDSAFYVDTLKDIQSLEMIFSPKSLSSGYLFYNKTGGTESYISWSANGTITKSNISGLYINGQDITSETNIEEHLYIDEPNYILIKTSSEITGEIWLNGKQDGGNRSGVLDDNMYQNIAIYESSSIDHLKHYNLYIGKDIIEANDSVIEITEEAVKTYSRDRVLLNNL
jgi:hypothetical protein